MFRNVYSSDYHFLIGRTSSLKKMKTLETSRYQLSLIRHILEMK
jgi:hypothetical protein